MNKRDKRYIETKFKKWKEKCWSKYIPDGLSKKGETEFLDEVYLARKGRSTYISGGGRVLWYHALRYNYPLHTNRSWTKFLRHEEKMNHKDWVLSIKKFRYRERLLGLDLLHIPEENIEGIIENKRGGCLRDENG